MCTVMVKVSVAPAARPEDVQVTVPEALTHPVEADTNEVPAARTSVTVYPALLDGPRFFTFTVHVSSVPAVAGSSEAVLVTLRSAERFTVTVAVSWSLADTGSAVAVVSMVAVLDRDPPSA